MQTKPTHYAVLIGALALLPLSACSPPTVTNVEPEVKVTGVDLRPYTEKGFLFTPEAYAGPYDAIGLIQVSLYAGAHYVVPEGGVARHVWQFDPIPVHALLDTAYARADAMGADALMKFQVEETSHVTPEGLTVPGLTVSGFAIRRRPSP